MHAQPAGGQSLNSRFPEREDLAKEMEDVINSFGKICRWKRSETTRLATYFPSEVKEDSPRPTKAMLQKGLGKSKARWPTMVAKARRKGENKPVEVRKDKYSREGRFVPSNIARLGLPKDMEGIVLNMANCSLARTTWRAYSTAERAAERCQMDTGLALNMPWSEREAVIFTAWCIQRNLAASTIKQYISGIKAAHKREGLNTEAWDHSLVKTIIKGRENSQEKRKQKIAMSPGLMLEIKRYIIRSSLTYLDKCILWACCTLMFCGSLRGGEVLGDEENAFDRRNILMEEDVKIKNTRLVDGRRIKMISCTIRNPKELPGCSEVEVEMFSTGNKFCPVQAVEKVKAARMDNGELPFATLTSGKILTKSRLNKFLKAALCNVVRYEDWTVSSHSFRAGIATGMARCGYSDEEIRRQGRWRSDAFLQYIRLGRAQRLEQQLKLSEDLASVAEAELSERPRPSGR